MTKCIRVASHCSLWCIMGDFSSVRISCERQGERVGQYENGERKMFNQFLLDMEVGDVPMVC